MGLEEIILQHYKEEGKTQGMIEGKAQGMIEGKAQGMIEGKIEAKNEGIKNALALNIPMDQICAIFKVTEEYVISLIEQNDRT